MKLFAIFLLIVLFAGCTSSPETKLEQPPAPSCPNGLVNDPYPGSCGRYTDANSNGFCDFSETA